MGKLSIGKNLFNFEENIKNDAMRPTIVILLIVLGFMTILVLFSGSNLIQYLAFAIIIGIILFAICVNHHFVKNDPDRLQTEKYLIHKQLIEQGMIEAKQGEIVESTPLIETNQIGEITSEITNETIPDEEEML